MLDCKIQIIQVGVCLESIAAQAVNANFDSSSRSEIIGLKGLIYPHDEHRVHNKMFTAVPVRTFRIFSIVD